MTSTRNFLLFLLTLSALLLAASSAFDDPRDLESVSIRMEFRGTATITGTAESLNLSLYKVPQGGNCTVPVKTDSEGRDFVEFSWEAPGRSASYYYYSCTLEAGRDNGPKLSRDEPLPSGSFGNYTLPSELVLITPEIASKAQALVAGVEGEFLAAGILSSWVHDHMDYDKDYFGRIMDSGQIFGEMAGVCEEYSHLLLALLRSLGIPSRYVAGFVYGQNGWDPHAWVEVYFPEQDAWIPFDPTYDENGYVDASHVKFFDSMDGNFAALRTSFLYNNGLGPKPSVDWDEPSPEVTVMDEKEGYGLLRTKVLQEEQNVKLGKNALVRAELENDAGTLLYPKVRLVYLAGNLGDDENLELVYGNETAHFALLSPNERKAIYWVLKVKSRYIISPKVIAENSPFDAGNITGLEAAGPDSELGLFSDKDAYAKPDVARVTATLKGRADAAVMTELTTGVSKTVPAGGRMDFMVPARNGKAAIYSSTGDFAEIPLPVRDSGLDARLVAPERAVAGRPFEVTISSVNDPMLQITASLGNRTSSGVGPLSFGNYTMAESGVITARAGSDGPGAAVTVMLRKYVEVLPAPEISVPQVVKSGPRIFNATVLVRNGNLSSAGLLAGRSGYHYYERLSSDSGRLTFEDGSARCGKRLKLRIEATTTDLLGQQDTGIYDAYDAELRCGFFETLLQKVLDVFLSPFLAR